MKKLLFMLLSIIPVTCMAQYDSKTCTGPLEPFEAVWRGQIKAEIVLAKNYFFDSANHLGSLGERKFKLDSVANKVFSDFLAKRTIQYAVARCHFTGSEHNLGSGQSDKSLTCDVGYVFVPATLRLYGKNPSYSPDSTKFTWHSGASSAVEIDAVIGNQQGKIRDELNLVRNDLADLGIPTQYPR